MELLKKIQNLQLKKATNRTKKEVKQEYPETFKKHHMVSMDDVYDCINKDICNEMYKQGELRQREVIHESNYFLGIIDDTLREIDPFILYENSFEIKETIIDNLLKKI